jgi:hypothetical protein
VYESNKIPGIKAIELSFFILSLPNKSSIIVCSDKAVDNYSFLLILQEILDKKLFPAEVNP